MYSCPAPLLHSAAAPPLSESKGSIIPVFFGTPCICILYLHSMCSELELNSFFAGMDINVTFPSEDGAAQYGASCLEVKSENASIEGYYKKISFHSVHPKAPGHEYPIYKQTGGGFNSLKIDDTGLYAPWLFIDNDGKIIYR